MPVVGAISLEGKVQLEVVADTTGETIQPVVENQEKLLAMVLVLSIDAYSVVISLKQFKDIHAASLSGDELF